MSLILQIQQAGTAIADTLNQAAQMASPVAPPAPAPTISLWDMLLKGGPIMIPIGILSVVAIYIFIERYLVISRASRIDQNFMNNIRDFMHNGNIESAKSLCKNTNSPIARLIEKGISRIGRPIKEIEDAIDYYSTNSSKAPVQFIESLLQCYHLLSIHPYYKIQYKNIRSLKLKKFPYSLFYTANEEKKLRSPLLSTTEGSSLVLGAISINLSVAFLEYSAKFFIEFNFNL